MALPPGSRVSRRTDALRSQRHRQAYRQLAAESSARWLSH